MRKLKVLVLKDGHSSNPLCLRFADNYNEYIANLFASALQEPSQLHEPFERIAILAGKSAGPVVDKGKIICTCMNVGLNQILEAISVGGACRVEELGACLKAGTQCGSCIPELKNILNTEDVAVVIDAHHLCVSSRGVSDVNSSTVTAAYGGAFLNSEKREEFLKYISLSI